MLDKVVPLGEPAPAASRSPGAPYGEFAMPISDWTLLGLDSLFGKVEEDAPPKEQMHAVLQIRDVIKDEAIDHIVLDMDHAEPDLDIDLARFNAALLADEMADAGLKCFALVHRDQVDPWWDHLLASLIQAGVNARDFVRRQAAIDWIEQEAEKARQAG